MSKLFLDCDATIAIWTDKGDHFFIETETWFHMLNKEPLPITWQMCTLESILEAKGYIYLGEL